MVESAFSRIKDKETQSVRRGTFRVMGRAKVSAVVLFNAMASNLIEVARWRSRKALEEMGLRVNLETGEILGIADPPV